ARRCLECCVCLRRFGGVSFLNPPPIILRWAVRPSARVVFFSSRHFPARSFIFCCCGVIRGGLADIVVAASFGRGLPGRGGTHSASRERVHGPYHQDVAPKKSPRAQGPPRVKIARTGTPRERKQTHR